MRRTISLVAAVVLVASGTLLGTTGAATGDIFPAHERELALKVGDKCSAPGCTSFRVRLSVLDDAWWCAARKPVRLQRWQPDGHEWELVERARTGHAGGAWFFLDSAKGLYRAVAPEVVGWGMCLRAVSPERRV